MADRIYSLTLALAMLTLAPAVVLQLAAWRRERPESSRFAWRAAAASLALVATSTLVHFGFGHRPGSPNALGALEFVGEHPANATVAVLAIALLGLGQRSRQRSSNS